MTSADFSAIALRLDLSNTGMAAALGVNVRRVRAYASGAVPVPRVVSLACQALRSEAQERMLRAWAAGLQRDINAMFGAA